MFDMSNGILRITRGDSAAINVDLKNGDGSPYIMKVNDQLVFTVKDAVDGTVKLKVTSYEQIIDLIPASTRLLPLGSCVYDIELRTNAGDVFTVAGLKENETYNMLVLEEVNKNE